MSKKILIVLGLVIIAAVIYSVYFKQDELPVVTQIPGDIAEHIESKSDLIVLSQPAPMSVISSPLVIRGRARGTWYFEASFPIALTNWDGLIIAEGHAEAQADWMTENFVPFEGTLIFSKPVITGDFSKRGWLILKKDNPSGLPEHDDALEIPVFFE